MNIPNEQAKPTLCWPEGALNPDTTVVVDGIEFRLSNPHTFASGKTEYTLEPILNHPILPFKAINDQAILPSRGYPDDAGLDLFACEDITIRSGEHADIPTGVAVELPPETWGMIIGRSSTLRKRNLLVNISVIDRGWRGDLFVNALNVSMDGAPVRISKGERVGQLIILPNISEGWTPTFVENLSDHARGTKGFGSTGL